MVSNDLLFYVHLRLNEIFGSFKNEPFKNLESLWQHFKVFEFTEIMGQRGDSQLIDLLNNVRIAGINATDIELLQSKVIKPGSANYPIDALHIFAENSSSNEHNLKMLQSVDGNLHVVPAIDILPKNIPQQKVNEVLNRKQSETGGLAQSLQIKLNARVMLAVNIDLQDRLVNGQLGTIKHISTDKQGNVAKIYIKFDDSKAGAKKINLDPLAKRNSWVPIEKTEVDIRIKSTKLSSHVTKRTQFPLMLAWACTVHKVQGLSLSKIVLSFQLLKQKYICCIE